jgi:hypothetical protein
MSLFGGAILATVATASFAQTYFSDVAAFQADTTFLGASVVLGGYKKTGDGGGGLLVAGGTVCSVDDAIVFQVNGTCFYRTDPTFSVREWGAKSDVVEVNPGTLSASWNPNPGSAMGTLSVPTALLPTPAPPTAGQFIAISQIGQPTLFTTSTLSSTSSIPAVSMTRFSTLGGTQVNYSPGNVITFKGTGSNNGTFSQQAAIVVDAVSNTGSITQWHVLWGGLYQPGAAKLPTSTMVQDSMHSYCGTNSSVGTFIACGTLSQGAGATLTPAWSGWSVLNSQSILNPGTRYVVGDVVTLTIGDTLVNQGHYATLVVEGTTNSGGVSGEVTAYDWLNYGSFNLTTASAYGTLSATAGSGASGLAFSPVAWTQAPYASTIVSAGTIGGGMSTIVVAGTAAFPGTIDVQSFYYGDDDSQAITAALASKPASALVIPAGCGTTVPLDLSQDSSANNANPALVGGDLQSTGIYAFAYPPTMRGVNSGAPVLSRVLYGGLPIPSTISNAGFMPTSGGGFRNMFVEGFGIPEGYGYWGIVEGLGKPNGYVGPTYNFASGMYRIPTAGTAVEIDQANLMRIDNVHITDGGIGLGNSAFQCGLDEADPSGTISGASATIVFTNSRVDANPAFFAGPSNPDFALRLGNSCRGSTFRNLAAYDGTKADVLQYNANVLSQIHVASDAANTTIPGGAAPTINWGTITSTTTFGFAGVASYGLYVIGATALSQTQCDIANVSCVLTIPYLPLGVANAAAGSLNAGNVTDTQVRCGAFSSVPTGYLGVELGAGALGTIINGAFDTTVSGTASGPKCAMPPLQLVVMDVPADPTSSLCNNSNALVAGCVGYQGTFAGGQFYTQPAVSFGTVSLAGNILYAVPFYSPASGGPITKLGLDVLQTGSATLCNVGVYNAFNGVPSTLVATGGTLSAITATTVTTSGAFSAPVELAPQTLYFLAVGCSGSVMVEGAPTASNSGFTGPLTGAPSFTAPTSQISVAWAFSAGSLPSTFTSTGTITTAYADVPNVYAGP